MKVMVELGVQRKFNEGVKVEIKPEHSNNQQTAGIVFKFCIQGNFSCFKLFFKINFFQKSFGNTFRVSNGLDSDQARHHVGPDLGPNSLQKVISR